MPYKSGDVPSGTEKVPPHGQSIYRSAFNAAYEKYGEEKAHAIAWSAVKTKFKKKGDRWVSKDGLQALDFWSEESRAAALEAKRAKAKEQPGNEEQRAKLERAKEVYHKELRENGENHPRTVAAEKAMLRAHREYGVVHRGEKSGSNLHWSGSGGYHKEKHGEFKFAHAHDYDPNQARDPQGRWTSGGGSGSGGGGLTGANGPHPTTIGHGYSAAASVDAKGVIHTTNVDDAVRALYEHRKVELNQPREVSTLLDRLGKVAAEMIRLGGKTPVFNLCDASVKGTNLFCAESLGIKREEMPQLDDAQTAAFGKLMAKTYGSQDTTEKASYLRATQDQLNGVKVARAAKSMQSDPVYAARRIIVSKDNYILDGHHSWAAHIGLDALNNVIGDKDMNVTRVNIPIIKLLDEAEKFTGGKGHKALGDRFMSMLMLKLLEDGGSALARLLAVADIKPCPTCSGAGKDGGGFKCKTCDGEGYVKDARRKPDSGDDDDDNGEDDGDEFVEDSVSTIQMTDNLVLDDKPHRTKNGYLAANARIARTGIQLYGGSELGMPHMDVVRVYRPPSEVFNKASMKSLAHMPITLNHPPTMVDSENWDDYSVGHTGDEVVRDGDCVRVPMVIMDGKAVKAYEQYGIKQLSVGYSTELKWGKGRTKDGEAFDAKQTSIRGNHLAVVPAARAGSRMCIGDEEREDQMVKVLIGGQSIEFHDELAGKHVADFVASQQQIIADQGKKLSAKAAEEEQEEEKKTRGAADAAAMKGEIVALKAQLADALTKSNDPKAFNDRIDFLIKAVAAMDGKASFDDLKTKSNADICRLVVTTHLGDAVKGLSDEEMVGAFKVVTAGIKPRNNTERLADNLALLQFGGDNRNDPKALKDAAYADMVKQLNNAWKTPVARNA